MDHTAVPPRGPGCAQCGALGILRTRHMIEETYLELDGRQLVFRSDVPEAHAFIVDAFGHMMVPACTHGSATLGFLRTPSGYAIESTDRSEWTALHAAPLVPLLKDEVRMQFMRSRPDLMWLHAGAAAKGGQAVLVSGASGQGKSTITTGLVERGWLYLSDDVAPVPMNADVVLPFPQVAFRRIAPEHPIPQNDVYTLPRENVSLRPEQIAQGEVPVGAIVFVVYSHGSAPTLTRLAKGSGALEMLRNLTNFMDHRAAAVERVADMAQRVPMFMLTHYSPMAAVSAVDELLSREL